MASAEEKPDLSVTVRKPNTDCSLETQFLNILRRKEQLEEF